MSSILSESEKDAARAYGKRVGQDLVTGRASLSDVLEAELEYAHFAWECRLFFGDDATTWPEFKPQYVRELEEHESLD